MGEFKWNDGRKYNGDWKRNLMNGHGELVYEDGRKYKGYFVNDKKHG